MQRLHISCGATFGASCPELQISSTACHRAAWLSCVRSFRKPHLHRSKQLLARGEGEEEGGGGREREKEECGQQDKAEPHSVGP